MHFTLKTESVFQQKFENFVIAMKEYSISIDTFTKVSREFDSANLRLKFAICLC